MWGVADRTDYDLTQHQTVSGKDLTYFDPETNERYIPYVVEPSLGVERSVLAVLVDAYDEEVVDAEKNDVRVVLHLHPALAPYKAAVLPLSKKLSDKAREIYAELAKEWMIDFDETGSIGKRYRREDEVGTPYCITVDFDTVGDAEHEGDNCVTVRERDTMQQVRVPISELKSYLAEKLAYYARYTAARHRKKRAVGAPSIRKVPQCGSCISIKFVSLKRCNPCGYAVFSLLRLARWCWKASSISSGFSSWRMPTPL